MASILLSGPAGASKSALAIKLLAENPALAVIADFQSIYRALTLVERDPSGRYPLRDDRLLPIVEYVRRAILTGAVARELDVIATNSATAIRRGGRSCWASLARARSSGLWTPARVSFRRGSRTR